MRYLGILETIIGVAIFLCGLVVVCGVVVNGLLIMAVGGGFYLLGRWTIANRQRRSRATELLAAALVIAALIGYFCRFIVAHDLA